MKHGATGELSSSDQTGLLVTIQHGSRRRRVTVTLRMVGPSDESTPALLARLDGQTSQIRWMALQAIQQAAADPTPLRDDLNP